MLTSEDQGGVRPRCERLEHELFVMLETHRGPLTRGAVVPHVPDPSVPESQLLRRR